MNKANILNTIILNKKVLAHHVSDGSELIPAEVKANTDFDSKIPILRETGTAFILAIAPLTAFTVS